MIDVICPACRNDGTFCPLCRGDGTIPAALLYEHEPKIHAQTAAELASFEPVMRLPLDLEPEPPTTVMFTGEDWIRFRDLAAAVPGCLLAVGARLISRWWR